MIRYIYIMFFAMLLLGGCTKDYVCGDGTLRLWLQYPSADMVSYSKSTATKLRQIVEIYKQGTNDLVVRKELYKIDNIDITLASGSYQVRVWSDYTHKVDQDLYYDTSSTNNISIAPKQAYIGQVEHKDAYAGVEYANIESAAISTLTINLHRPFAKFELIANDVEQYEELRRKTGYPSLEELRVEIVYEGYFPSAYNMTNHSLSGASTGYSFVGGISQIGKHNALLADDYVLADKRETSINVGINVRDVNGKTISATSGVVINYKANQITTIQGNFLTNTNDVVIVDHTWEGNYKVWF